MPTLSDPIQRRGFVSRLEHCEHELHGLMPYEHQFIRDMRDKFESREDAEDLGMSPWNPSKDQWNFLDQCAAKLRWRGVNGDC